MYNRFTVPINPLPNDNLDLTGEIIENINYSYKNKSNRKIDNETHENS